MAAPNVSLANPSATGQDGLSAMLARIKDRAASRRVGMNVDPQELTPLGAMSESDSLQAANFDGGESPMVAAIGSSGGSSGGNPMRFASMTEDDNPEAIAVADCDDGQCGQRRGMEGLPAGARIINERTVSSGMPSGMTAGMPAGMPTGMPMAGEVVSTPQYYPSKIKGFDDEYFAIKDPTATQTVRYLMQRAAALEEASNAPGVPASTRANMAGSANAARERAMDMFQDAQVVDASDRKIAEAVEARKDRDPRTRMETMRGIISGSDNSINVAGKYPPEVRVQMIVDSNNAARMGQGKDGGILLTEEEQSQEKKTLMEMAVAADISLAMTRHFAAEDKPFERGRQTYPYRLAVQYYGPLTPAAREETMTLDLKPAIEQQMIEVRKANMGDDYEPTPRELRDFSQQALAQVDSIRDMLSQYDQQRGAAGARNSLYSTPVKPQTAAAPTAESLPKSLQTSPLMRTRP